MRCPKVSHHAHRARSSRPSPPDRPGVTALTPADTALLGRAFAQVKAGENTAADATLADLSLAARGHPDALMVTALARKATGDMPAALRLFKAATHSAPKHPAIWNSYANCLDELGDHDAAIVAYRRALAIDPQASASWINLALAAVAAKRWDDAAAAATRALALVPTDRRALTAAAMVAEGRGDLNEAVVAYSGALAVAPGDAVVRHNLAAVLRRQGLIEAALALVGPDAPVQSRLLRANLLADTGEFNAAIDTYHSVLSVRPADLPTLAALAELLPQLGQADAALTAYHAALASAAAPDLWRAAIGAAKGIGAHATALAWARRAEAAHGHHSDWTLAAVDALSRLGNDAAALALAHPLAADAPSAAAETMLAWLLLKAGDAGAAEPHALAASRLQPLGQTPWALLTLIWRLLRDQREAWLADYDRLVIASEIMPPPGWSSLAGFLGDLTETLTKRHLTLAAPADQSLRGGTQTRGDLFATTDPVLLGLQASLVNSVEAGLASLVPDTAHPFLGRLAAGVTMAGSWSVRLRAQGFHISHIHHKGWLSSAFYVGVPPEINAGSEAGTLRFGVPDAALGLDLSPRRIVTPSPGRLVIFPSYFWHGTAPFESAAPRLTVAFDALPRQ